MNKNLIGAMLAATVLLGGAAFVVVKALFNPAFVDDAIFLAAAVVSVGMSVIAVTRRNPVYSILNLLGVFVMMAALFFVLAADLLAVLQILVYAGAILMLFLFVIMLFNLGGSDPAAEQSKHEGSEIGRLDADAAEKAGFGHRINTPKLRALAFASGLFVLLAFPVLMLSGDQWESFLPRYAPTGGGVEDLPALREFRVWIDLSDTELAAKDYPAADGTLVGTVINNDEGERSGYRLSWTGQMTVAQRDSLLEVSEDGQWKDAIRQLWGTSNWQAREIAGMTDAELAHGREMAGTLPVKREGFGSIPRVGWDLFNAYLVPFEFVSLILLAGMVGAVVLALRRRQPGEGGPLVPTKPEGDGDVSLFERHLGPDVGQGLVNRPALHDTSLPAEHKQPPEDDAIYDTDGDDD